MSDYARMLFTAVIGGFVLYALIHGSLTQYVKFAKA